MRHTKNDRQHNGVDLEEIQKTVREHSETIRKWKARAEAAAWLIGAIVIVLTLASQLWQAFGPK